MLRCQHSTIRLERKFVLFPSGDVRGSFEKTGSGRVGKEGLFTSTSPRRATRCAQFSCQPFGFLAKVTKITGRKHKFVPLCCMSSSEGTVALKQGDSPVKYSGQMLLPKGRAQNGLTSFVRVILTSTGSASQRPAGGAGQRRPTESGGKETGSNRARNG